MPRISIVMPVYNGEKYLRESIDSILAQTFKDWEFIIINEYGSNDAATAILQEYALKDKRIVLVQNERRLGIAASMDIGLDFAKGEYIARMDADDKSMPERLKKQVEFMDANPKIDICGIKPKLFGEASWDWRVETKPEILKSCILFYTPFVHPTVIMRTARLNQYHLRYDPEYKYTEDYDFFARASDFLTFSNIEDTSLFHYRMHSKNATSVGGDQGVNLYRGVTKRLVESCGLVFTEHEADMLCIHTYPRSKNVEQALDDMSELDLLLKRIFFSETAREKYGTYPLFRALHIRWMRVKEDMQYTKSVMADDRFEAALNRGLFFHCDFYCSDGAQTAQNPKVSIVLPTYNSEKYIADTLYSLLDQTFTDFEVLVINELGSNDQTVKIINLFHDPRVRVIQNEVRLGLADSLNEGIRQALGEYIARADADDLYPKDRLEKQVAFLDQHPDISVCGSWQRHFGKRNHIHKPRQSPEQMKAQLLFTCDVCHSTLMLRKEDFIRNNFWYDSSYLSEDFELWSRAVQKLKFATIQEVLGEYRWDGDNITASKMERLDQEAQKILARTLKSQLKINISENDNILLSGWFNPFQDNNRSDTKKLIKKELDLLSLIEHKNQEYHIYDEKALNETLMNRKRWVQGNDWKELAQKAMERHMTLGEILKRLLKKILIPFYRPFKHRISDRFDQLRDQLWDMDGHVCDVKETVRQHDLALQNSLDRIDYLEKSLTELSGLAQKINEDTEFGVFDKRISKGENNILQTIDDGIKETESNILKTMDGRIQEAESNILKTMDGRIQGAEGNILKTMDGRICKIEQNSQNNIDEGFQQAEENHKLMTQILFEMNKVPFVKNEKIRIVFLFQAASFWPSWESVWNGCLNDSRIEAKMLLFNRHIGEAVQMQTAEDFLKQNEIEYTQYDDFDIDEYKPHIMVFQTPYDNWHRPQYLWYDVIKGKGIRPVCICYGIEIDASKESMEFGFSNAATKYSWRNYVMSAQIRKDYLLHCKDGAYPIRVTGHPKFDSYFNQKTTKLRDEISQKLNNRKIVAWLMHFPHHIKSENGEMVMDTPYLSEYLRFSTEIEKYPDLFFVVRPHPKFFEMSKWIENGTQQAQQFKENILKLKNAYLDIEDTYYDVLANADCFIVDPSALGVEAGARGKPVLYMTNKDHPKELSNAVASLFNSYYQGTTCEDMLRFIEMYKRGEDSKQVEREAAFQECVPYFDGRCGNRIVEDMVLSLNDEK